MMLKFFSNPALVTSLLIATATASTEVPIWISVFSFFVFVWKFLNEKKMITKIPVKWTALPGAMLFVLVYLQYHNIFGVEESSIILIGLMSLTVLNYKTRRDHQFLVLLGFIIMMIKVTFTVDLVWVIPTVFVFFSLWHSLLLSSKIDKNKFLFWTALKSVPVLLLLFILFPRIILFQTTRVPRQALAQTAYSEDLKPGQFSDVSQWDQLAFRAEFSNREKIPLSQLYWRGTVLSFSKGFEWSRGPITRKRLGRTTKGAAGIEYTVIQEPSGNQKAVFVLDPTRSINYSSDVIEEWPQSTYRLDKLSLKQLQFAGTADARLNGTDSYEYNQADEALYLQVPKLPVRTQAWIQKTKDEYSSQEERLEALVAFFSDPNFIYTLSPGTYLNNDMDDFLFVRKKGFCEHFAAAFASMARALEIPSRIVIGYQGGSYNFIGGFWKVAQKDTHVWTELAVKERWVRYDPTRWISPLRISLGAENFFSLSKEDQVDFSHNPNWQKPEDLFTALDNVSAFIENVNYSWTLFVLDFDKETQLNFLKQLRGSWMFAGFVFLILLWAIYNKNYFKNEKTENHFYYTELLLTIEKNAQSKGVRTSLSMPPLAILDRINQGLAESHPLIAQFKQEYQDVIYRGQMPTKTLRYWKRQWEIFFKSEKIEADKKT